MCPDFIGNLSAIYRQSRRTRSDELELAWLNLKIRGTDFLAAKDIEKRIEDLRTQDKKKNIAGLQLADLVVSPIGRHVLGKSEQEDFRGKEKHLPFCQGKQPRKKAKKIF